MLINIANVKSFKNLEDITIKVAKEEGFNHEDTYNLILSKIPGKGKSSGKKLEPIFVFRKV